MLAVATLLGIAWNMLSARILGPIDMGKLAIVMLYPLFFFTIGHLTFNIGTIYRVGQYPLGELAANALFVALSMGILLYIVFAVTLPLFQNTLYKGVEPKYLYVAFIVVPCYLIVYLLASVLQGSGRFKEYNIVNLIRCVSAILCLTLFIIVLKFGLLGAVVAFTASYFISAIVAVVYVLKLVKGTLLLNLGLLGSTLKDGGTIHIASIATFIYSQVGLIIANYYLTSGDVGFLFVALVCVQFLFLIPQATQTVLYSEVAKSTDKGAEITTAMVCRHTFFWVLVGAVVVALLSSFIVRIFGSAYMPAVNLLLILLPGAILVTVAQIMSALWIKKRWFWFMVGSGVFICIIGLLAQLILIPRYSLLGSVLATDLTYLAGFLVVVGVYYFYVNRNVWELFIPQQNDFAIYKNMFVQIREVIH